ncbi:TOMM precursor leader peptide-binding protein [Paenibacillus sp. EPM92]|uniref:TOMM precursor leader peptide-binding protein n=1 Tax=Paenibacillus sp. EPM92 TaxID=1561195 RepID=UPI001915035D|nr:TOMM precursor leader peptide-binding protein [Paenibacillus sp. EPM92]
MSAVVAVVGDGLLADYVCSELSAQYQVVRQTGLRDGIPQAAELALLLHDAWHPSAYHEAEEVFQSAGIAWLRGFVHFGEGLIGPLVRPGIPGCSQCADMRHLMAGRDRKEMWELRQSLAAHEGFRRDAWASRTGLLQAAHLLAAEARRALQGEPALLGDKVYAINLKTLRSSLHFFLPNPLCSVCGQVPDDSPEAAHISLQPNPKSSPDSFRCRPLDELKQVLLKDYLDYRTGLLNGKMVDLVSPFADVTVNQPLFTGDEVSAGRTHSYAESELTAVLEALERYGGVTPRGKRTVIRDSFSRLRDQALNPFQVGVHDKAQYERPRFPFKPFHPDRKIDWVWGYSFLQERPILVPELLSYYSLGCGHGFVYETSNGCALGGSLEEAIFYGILEIVERDSFLLTWYAQLPLPRLELRSADDEELQLMVERVQAVAGFDLHVFNATMENGIPSVWAVAKNRKPTGLNLICAAGSHLDPIRAVKGAIYELAGMMRTMDEKFEANREEYARMLQDSSLVQQMEHHSMLYGLPQAEERLHFLLDEKRPLRTFNEEFKPRERRADLTDDLMSLIQVFNRLNLEVIVVNQTTAEMRRNGLHCVKVLIPGMLPMTFGHHLTRLTGLERVLRVPAELGYVKQPLTPEQLNPHPHPFP